MVRLFLPFHPKSYPVHTILLSAQVLSIILASRLNDIIYESFYVSNVWEVSAWNLCDWNAQLSRGDDVVEKSCCRCIA